MDLPSNAALDGPATVSPFRRPRQFRPLSPGMSRIKSALGLLFPAEKTAAVGSRARPTALSEVARYLHGTLANEGFGLFRNGGLPLLERRRGPWRQEIVLYPGPRGAPEVIDPVVVRLHLSHQDLALLRERTSGFGRRGGGVASGSIGELEPAPCCNVVWDAADGLPALVDVGAWVRDVARPRFERFEDPTAQLPELFEQAVPLVDHRTAIQLLLHHIGPQAGRAYFHEVVHSASRIRPCVTQALRLAPIPLTDAAEKVALAALAYESRDNGHDEDDSPLGLWRARQRVCHRVGATGTACDRGRQLR